MSGVKRIKRVAVFLIGQSFLLLPFALIVLAFLMAVPAVKSLVETTETLECFCPSCPETAFNELGANSLGLIRVDIAGAVTNPGVYQLEIGSRNADLLEAAGGLSQEAAPNFLAKNFNLATELENGGKVYIPYAWEEEWQLVALASAQVKSDGGEGDISSGAESESGLISVNQASASELEGLAGIGEKRAADIIAGRPYQNLTELTSKGVLSESLFDDLKEQLSL